MRVPSLLIIWSLPLLPAGEPGLSPSSDRGPVALNRVGAEVHPICLERHQDESCPCGYSDDSLCPSYEDDDALEELHLARGGRHTCTSSDLDLNRRTTVAFGHAIPSLAVRSRPLRC